MISSMDENSIKQAMEAVEGMFKKVEVGEEYDGKVVRIAPFGAFVQILPGKDGLVHVSQMAPERVEKPEDVVSEGQEVHVRVIDVDSQGKIALSMLFGADIKPDEGRGRRGGGGGSGSGGYRDRGGDRGSSGPRRDFGRSGGADRGAPPPFKRNRRNFGR
jgi:polyribonucleotide nucleotidyltransferase